MRFYEFVFEYKSANQKKIDDLIDKVKTGTLSTKDLVSLDNNLKDYDPNLVKPLRDEIKKYLRKNAPRSAGKVFGRKGDEVIAVLQDIHDQVSQKYDLSKSKNENKVKPHGNMISGQVKIQYFINFVAPGGLHAGLSLVQKDYDSELMFDVYLGLINKREYGASGGEYGTGEMERKYFNYNEKAQAIRQWEKFLDEVGAPKK